MCKMKKILLNFVIGSMAFLTFKMHAQNNSGMFIPAKKVYPVYVQPEQYPMNVGRDKATPNWSLFDNRMQFKDSKLYERYYVDILELTEYPTHVGVRRLEDGIYSADAIAENAQYTAEGGIIYSAGFKPFRSPTDKNHNMALHLDKSYTSQVNNMYSQFNGRFLGMNFGEADATWMNLSCCYHYPLSRTKEMQASLFAEHLQYYGDQIGNYALGHHNECAWACLTREGLTTMLGAQLFYRGNTNPRVHYSFFRGIGRQYGVLWHATMSEGTILTGYKCYWFDPARQKDPVTNGASLNLLRRAMYSAWQWECTFMGFEMGPTYRKPGGHDTTPLHPRGESEAELSLLIDEYGMPGVMQCPVAFMLDPFNGWRSPNKRKKKMMTWTGIPYTGGDHLTNQLFDMIYPGHVNVGQFKNERYAFPETPYGDSFDVLHSDVQTTEMNRYPVIVAAGEISTNLEVLKNKIETYVQNGGNYIVTAGNAAKIWPEYEIQHNQTSLSSGATISFVGGDQSTLENSCKLSSINASAGYNVIASAGSSPAIVEIPKGEGAITIILSEWGLNDEAGDMYWPNYKKEFSAPLGSPYHLTAFTKEVLSKKFKAMELFSVNDSLAYIVNYRGDNEFLVGLYNDHINSVTFDITSNVGNIISKEEIILGDTNIKEDEAYFARDYTNHDGGLDDDENIYGGDVRLFLITVDGAGSAYTVNTQLSHEQYATNNYLMIDNLGYLRKELTLQMPEFKHYYKGVCVKGQDLLDCSEAAIARDFDWFVRKKLYFVVDITGISSQETLAAVNAKAALLPNLVDIIDDSDSQQEQNASKSINNLKNIDNSNVKVYSKESTWGATYLATQNEVVLNDEHVVLNNESFTIPLNFVSQTKKFNFSFKAKGSKSNVDFVKVLLKNNEKVVVSESFSLSSIDEWEQIQSIFIVEESLEAPSLSFVFSEGGQYYIDDILLDVDQTTGTKTIANDKFILYPTLVKSQLNYKTKQKVDKIEIYNITGALCGTYVVKSKRGSLDVAALKKGTYLVKFIEGNNVVIKKIIKK